MSVLSRQNAQIPAPRQSATVSRLSSKSILRGSADVPFCYVDTSECIIWIKIKMTHYYERFCLSAQMVPIVVVADEVSCHSTRICMTPWCSRLCKFTSMAKPLSQIIYDLPLPQPRIYANCLLFVVYFHTNEKSHFHCRMFLWLLLLLEDAHSLILLQLD